MSALHRATAPHVRSHAPLWWLLVPVLLVMVWLGARELNTSLWIDEYKSILDTGGGPFERRTLVDIWNGVAARHGVHPPGYYMLLSAWGALTGWQPPILRVVSLLAGVLTAAWTYRVGRDWLSARAGLYAAAVLGVSSFFIYHLHELRMYTLLPLFTTMTLWHYLFIMNPRSRPRAPHWTGLFAGALAALYIQYFSIPFFGALAFYHVLLAPLTGRWRPVIGVLLLAGLLFVPWLAAGIGNGIGIVAENDALHERAMSAPEVVTLLLNLFGNGSAVLVGLAGAAALLAFAYWRRRAAALWCFALATLALIIAVNAVLELLPSNRMRYTTPMFPLLALLIALGMVALERWRVNRVPVGRIAAGVLLAAWLVNGVAYTLSDGYELNVFPYHTAADPLRDRVQTQDMVLIVNNNANPGGVTNDEMLLRYYLEPLAFDAATFATNSSVEQAAAQETRLQSLVDTPRPNLWVLYNPAREPSYLPHLQETLDQAYAVCAPERDIEDARIVEYARSPVCCSSERNVSDAMLRYANGIALLKVAPLPEMLAGETLTVSALWHIPPDVPANAYSVSFQVYDAARTKVAQTDVTLDAVAYACSSVDIALDALDAGDYTLEAVVYSWETGERLTATRADSTVSDLQGIGAFHVAG